MHACTYCVANIRWLWLPVLFDHAGCKGGYTRAEKFGAIIVGNNHNTRLRQNVTVSVSLDNGLTYPHRKTIWGLGGYVGPHTTAHHSRVYE